MRLSAGSAPWLLRHELRLLWRRYNLARRWRSGIVLAVGIGVLAQLLGLGAAAWLQDSAATEAGRVTVANIAVLCIAGLMLSHALDVAVASLFERQDLDWLLASPVPLRRVLAVRMMGMAVTIAGPWLLLAGPAANAMAWMGQPGWLGVYPALFALGLLAAAAGTWLGVRLVAATGLRRARRVVGGLSLLTGALAFLASQCAALLTPPLRAAVWDALSPPCCGPPWGVAWWPARALLGEGVPLLALLLAGASAAAAAAVALQRRFADGAALAPPRPAAAAMEVRPVDAGRFRRGVFGTVLRKELRLIWRTPNLIARAGYQLIYVIPTAGVLWRDGPGAAALGLGTVGVFIAGEAARLFVLAAVGDEAAELAAAAPVRPGLVQRAKMAAAGVGAAAVALVPGLGVAATRPGLLPVLLCGIGCVTLSGLLLGVWRPGAPRRTDLGGRRPGLADTDWLGLVVGGCWSGATWLVMAGFGWVAAVPAGVAMAVLLAVRRWGGRVSGVRR